MLLTKLSRYARRRQLMDRVDLTPRKVALTINIDSKGNIDSQVPVSPLTSADGKEKFQVLLCPAFPGEKNGGKADFLFETPGRVLGTETEEIARKTHESFWSLVREAREATGDARLEAVLKAGEISAQSPSSSSWVRPGWLHLRLMARWSSTPRARYVNGIASDTFH